MNKLNILFWAILMIGGYTLGSVMFSKEIPKLLGYGDITEKSNDRNPRSEEHTSEIPARPMFSKTAALSAVWLACSAICSKDFFPFL